MTDVVGDSTRLWKKAAGLFDHCLELPESQQADFLRRSCGGEGELREAVERLLRLDDTRDVFLDRGPVTAMEDALSERLAERWIGRTLGAYQLAEPLGQGGMGQVFLAHRADQTFSKRVAVKIFAAGLVTDELVAGFRRERQILATLEHPNIARLIDGGSTEEGLPYLVLEYVVGESMVRFCDRRRLDLKSRIGLFCKVCEAVNYAHRALVVHQDLKPANILITEHGEPKLLDFGIAKLLDDSVVDANRRPTVVRALTPAYASPEQILGQPISTSSDVYSLGVLLYELLTGCLPFARAESWAEEVLEQVRERQPQVPSSLFHAAQGAVEPAVGEFDRREQARLRGARQGLLARQLAGDLDNIVLRAMQPRVDRRYESVVALSEDLGRHLQGRPVRARKDSLSYRAGKFLRRNRWAVAGTLLLVVMASLAVLRIVREREFARAEQRKAERVAALLIESFKLADPQWSSGETVTAREVLDAAAARLENELVDEPILRATMMHTIGTVYTNLDLYEKANPHLASALELRRRHLGSEHPGVAESLAAWARMQLGQGQLDLAFEAATEALELRRQGQQAGLAASLQLLAEVEIEQGHRESAVERLNQALQLQRKETGERAPEYIEALMLYGQSIQLLQADYSGAEKYYLRALDLQRELQPRDHPRTAEILGQLARITQVQNRLPEAAELGHEALAMSRRLHGEEHQSVAQNLNALANIERLSGRVEEAEKLYRQSLAVRRQLVGDDHPKLASAMYNLATLLASRPRPARQRGSTLSSDRRAVSSHGRGGASQHGILQDGTRPGSDGSRSTERGRDGASPGPRALRSPRPYGSRCSFSQERSRWGLDASRSAG